MHKTGLVCHSPISAPSVRVLTLQIPVLQVLLIKWYRIHQSSIFMVKLIACRIGVSGYKLPGAGFFFVCLFSLLLKYPAHLWCHKIVSIRGCRKLLEDKKNWLEGAIESELKNFFWLNMPHRKWT